MPTVADLADDAGAQRVLRAPLHRRHRLIALHRHGVLDRFRPRTPIGSAPWHYVLGEAGAAVLAQEDGIDLAAFGYRRDRALSIAYSQRLTHTIDSLRNGPDLAVPRRAIPSPYSPHAMRLEEA
ncbi:replication-relaxation family protein [Nonomuraea polychroma]|uniref:replication-relaxation family protein n=1 Tax=Nonomuraea polychroma TaxID=46176 RepID=UPI000FDD879B